MRVGVPLLQDQLNAHSGGWVAGFHYVRNALNALALGPPRDVPEVLAFVPASFGESLVLPEYAERAPWLTVVRVPDELLSERWGAEGLQAFLDQHPVDVVFPVLIVPPAVFQARSIGWIPDLQHKRLPDFFSVGERCLRDRLFAFLVSFCDRIACSSEAVCSDLHEFFPEARAKGVLLRFASTIPAAACESEPRPRLEKLGITRKYIYLPNQFWVHKNHRLAFEAWRLLREAGHDFILVCTGWSTDYRSPHYYDQLMTFVAEHRLEDQIRVLGFLSRDEQIQLYRGAGAVLQPSLFEGWSTSIEEAKGLGKRLIVSDISVHREQCGEDACYFKKDSSEDLARAVEAAWPELPDGHDPIAEASGRRDGAERVERFGRSLVELFNETYGLGPRGPSVNEPMLGLLVSLYRVVSLGESESLVALAVSEADRAARLDVINRLNEALAVSEAERVAQKEILNKLPLKVLRYLKVL